MLVRQRPDGMRAAGRFLLRTARMRLPALLARMRERPPRIERGARPVLAILVSGGIGDYVVIARFLRDLGAASGGLDMHVFASLPGPAAWVFGAVPGFRGAYRDTLYAASRGHADVALRIHQAVMLDRPPTASSPALAAICDRIAAMAAAIEPFLRHHPELDHELARRWVAEGRTRRDALHAQAGIAYGGDALDLALPETLGKFGLQPGRYITVHNGYEAALPLAGRRATKCYPHFDPVVRSLRTRFGDLAVVQIGTLTSERIASATHDLIGRTSIAEAAAILRGSLLHLDNESGLVHIAASLGVPACVVFGPTPADYFAYPGHIAIGPASCGDCWWTKRDWMDQCPRGFAEPVCTHGIEPERVVKSAAAFLATSPSLAPA